MLSGGKKFSKILKITPSIELMHSYLLIHDDIQDVANLRRGSKTVHTIYKEVAQEITGSYEGTKHFGESIGINSGNTLNHLGTIVLLNSSFPNDRKISALQTLNRRIMDVVYGQTLDIFGEIMEDVDERYVKQVQHLKTGVYTYETPLHIGAILAGKNGDYLETLSKYAIPGGIAFQIQDDILGVFGSEEKTGKSAASDILDGKKTLLTVKAYKNGTKKDKVILDTTLGNRKATKAQIEEVKKIMIDTGALQYSVWLAKMMLTKSSNALLSKEKELNLNKEALDFLVGINDYMYQREF